MKRIRGIVLHMPLWFVVAFSLMNIAVLSVTAFQTPIMWQVADTCSKLKGELDDRTLPPTEVK